MNVPDDYYQHIYDDRHPDHEDEMSEEEKEQSLMNAIRNYEADQDFLNLE